MEDMGLSSKGTSLGRSNTGGGAGSGGEISKWG